MFEDRLKSFFFICLVCFCNSVFANKPIEIKVGGYQFEPFLSLESDGTWKGETIDLIEKLNLVQGKYHFSFFPTSSKRRYSDLYKQSYDLIFFEQDNWGWDKNKVNFTVPFYFGGEVYVSLNTNHRDEGYFSTLKKKRIAVVRGFHYGFARFETDPKIISQKFNVEFSPSSEAAIEMLVKNRVDIAVVPKLYIHQLISSNRYGINYFLVSKNFDQIYRLRGVVRNTSKIDVSELNFFLSKIIKGKESIWGKANF